MSDASEPRPVGYSWEDFVALDEDDPRELVDGALMEIDVPTVLHEWIVGMLVHRLLEWVLPRKAGVVVPSGYRVRIRRNRGVMPDVQFFRAGRALPAAGLDSGAPDLAVEVVSPTSGRYDRVEKLHWYASIGLPEYWIVDAERHTLERLVLDDQGTYRMVDALAEDAVFRPESFPGLAIELAELWKVPGGG